MKTLKILQSNVKGMQRFYAELFNDIEIMDHMYTNDVMVFTEIWLNDGNKEGFKDIFHGYMVGELCSVSLIGVFPVTPPPHSGQL